MAITAVTTRRFAAGVLLLLGAMLCVAWPLRDLVTTGPFAWHFVQPGAVEGGIELVVLAALLFGALSLRAARWRLPLAGLLLAIYLRRHHADFVAFVALFHLELLLAAGAAVCRAVRIAPRLVDGDAYLRWFVVGLGVLATIRLASSLAGNGQAQDLRGLTVIIALPVFAFARARPLAWHAAQFAARAEPVVRGVAAMLLAWLAATFARSGNVLGYDSAWYGLRGDLVLAPERSLFDATGMVSPVHYFPKLYELLLLPLNGLGTFQHATALATAMLTLLALAAWRFSRALGASEREAAWAALLAVTLPVVANHAISTKPDLLALVLLLVAARFVVAFAKSSSRDDALVAFAALLLAVQTRIGAGAFCAAIGGVLVLLALRRRSLPPARAGWLAVGFAAVVTAVLTARTLLLAGVPTVGPEPLLALWSAAGFTVLEPVGALDWLRPQDWRDVPALVLDFLFRPAHLPHIQVTWTGNAWLWCAIVLLVAGGGWRALRARPAAAWLLAACGATGVWLALGQRWMERGGDGNYFMFAPVLALLALVPLALRRGRHRAIPFALALFVAMQGWYAFTSAGWGTPGTRAWDFDFARGPVRATQLRHDMWQAAGMLELAEAIAREPRTLRLAGDIPETEGFLLRARFEPLSHMYFSGGDRFATAVSLQHLLDSAGVDALVVPAPGTEDPARILPAVLELTAQWRADPAVRRVPAGRWELLVRE